MNKNITEKTKSNKTFKKLNFRSKTKCNKNLNDGKAGNELQSDPRSSNPNSETNGNRSSKSNPELDPYPGQLRFWESTVSVDSDISKASFCFIRIKRRKKRKCPDNNSFRLQPEIEFEGSSTPRLSHGSVILDDNKINTLAAHLPKWWIEGKEWHLQYSSFTHGFSLNTLYRTMHGLDHPTLLILKDSNFQIFGAAISNPPSVTLKYYGNGESFLFTFYNSFRKFGWSDKNNLFIKGNTDSLFIGAGSGVGIWLNDSLYRGRTQACETFNNTPLTDREDFLVTEVEAWIFR